MLVELQCEFVFADMEEIFEYFDWNLADFAPPELSENEFNITPQGSGYLIDLDGNRLKYEATQRQMPTFLEVEGWTVAGLVSWLDGKLETIDISQPALCGWLLRVVEHLTEGRGINLSALMLAKYVLASKLRHKIDCARKTAKEQLYQKAFFTPESQVKLDFDNGFEFKEGMYDGVPLYKGQFKFAKHLFGSRVPAFDGKDDGEEFLCAQAIDQLPDVKHWVRNVHSHTNSFCMITSSGNFYPDFVAELQDGRLLVVEYKGHHLLNASDTKEKRLMGEFYANKSEGRLRFVMPSIPQGTRGNAQRECIEQEIVRAIR